MLIKFKSICWLSITLIILSHQSITHAEDTIEIPEHCKDTENMPNKDLNKIFDCNFLREQQKRRIKEQEYRLKKEEREKELVEKSPPHSGKSYDRCIIKEMPFVQNDLSARSIMTECLQYPMYYGEKKTDLFGHKSASECFRKEAKTTPSSLASKLIADACQNLFPGGIFDSN